MININQAESWEDLPPMLTTAEVCQLFRVGERTVNKWADNKMVTRSMVANGWKYSKQSLKSLAERLKIDLWQA